MFERWNSNPRTEKQIQQAAYERAELEVRWSDRNREATRDYQWQQYHAGWRKEPPTIGRRNEQERENDIAKLELKYQEMYRREAAGERVEWNDRVGQAQDKGLSAQSSEAQRERAYEERQRARREEAGAVERSIERAVNLPRDDTGERLVRHISFDQIDPALYQANRRLVDEAKRNGFKVQEEVLGTALEKNGHKIYLRVREGGTHTHMPPTGPLMAVSPMQALGIVRNQAERKPLERDVHKGHEVARQVAAKVRPRRDRGLDISR